MPGWRRVRLLRTRRAHVSNVEVVFVRSLFPRLPRYCPAFVEQLIPAVRFGRNPTHTYARLPTWAEILPWLVSFDQHYDRFGQASSNLDNVRHIDQFRPTLANTLMMCDRILALLAQVAPNLTDFWSTLASIPKIDQSCTNLSKPPKFRPKSANS